MKAVLALLLATALTAGVVLIGILPLIRAQALSAGDCWYMLNTPCPFLGVDTWQLLSLLPQFVLAVPVGLTLGIVVWLVARRRETSRVG